MEFRTADTFTYSLAKLTGNEQKAAKTTAYLQMPPAPGLSYTRPTTAYCCAMLIITIMLVSGLSEWPFANMTKYNVGYLLIIAGFLLYYFQEIF